MDNYFLKPGFLVKDDSSFAWQPLTLASWYDKNYKEDKIEEEYLKAYLSASKDLQDVLSKRTHPHPMMTVLSENQTCMPFLFSCRHLIELAMKNKLKNLDVDYEKDHNIRALWTKIKSITTDYDRLFDELIDTFNYTDENGFGLRYPRDKKTGKLYDKGPVSINDKRIIEYTERLYSFIMNLEGDEK